ncbi:MAG TPA: NADH-quinone oxidoreductase subunit C [Pyrinomonadaceae bacterium]|jgi:NADH-quinone oxidoreductase subunit C|nr:NADH-quinone oxidoreductase subunit C [Pyrinomonadaceae bacterium]
MTSGENNETVLPESNANPNQTATPSQLVAALQREHEGWIDRIVEAHGEVTAIVSAAHIVEVCAALKADPAAKFDFLADLCGVDRGVEEEPRFEVNYHLFSTTKHHRLRLKVLLDEAHARVPTVTGVWRTANWHERETFDLFGVVFEGHPDLRRILLPDDWQGYSLRKDFPLRGYEPYSLK